MFFIYVFFVRPWKYVFALKKKTQLFTQTSQTRFWYNDFPFRLRNISFNRHSSLTEKFFPQFVRSVLNSVKVRAIGKELRVARWKIAIVHRLIVQQLAITIATRFSMFRLLHFCWPALRFQSESDGKLAVGNYGNAAPPLCGWLININEIVEIGRCRNGRIFTRNQVALTQRNALTKRFGEKVPRIKKRDKIASSVENCS